MTIALARAPFPHLPAGFEPPRYDPARVTPGIVHIGLGGFHRAHMARYTHDLMGLDEGALDWGIRGAGLRAADRELLAALTRQDGLYSLIEREGTQQNRLVIASIVAAIDASQSADTLLAAMGDQSTRIVSTTVTENGYYLDRATRTIDFADPAIAADLADPGRPRTAPGILVEALRRRRETGSPGFTVLCCDNIPHNGNVLKAAVLSLAARQAPELADWIDASVSFPNSMVDRITPFPTAAEIAAFAAETGLDDRASLHCELFRQWVIEDDFVAGRPAWERVGAQFVADVGPYEFMKLRLLNGSHLAIAALGQLRGYVLISETIEDPLIRRYMTALMDKETGPTLIPVPGVDLAQYKHTLIARFANRAIRDTTQRVNTDAPVNLLIDPIRDRLSAGREIELLSLALAAWCRRVSGRGEQGEAIAVVHPLASLLAAKAAEGGRSPVPILGIQELFGSLGEEPRLVEPTGRWLGLLYDSGVATTLQVAADKGLF